MSVPIVHRTPANPRAAAENRRRFDASGSTCLNLIGAASSGKTALLEAILPRLTQEVRVGVIVGDLVGTADVDRLAAFRVPIVQLLTDGQCHLSAAQVQAGMREMPLDELDLLIVENVGTLACQAGIDFGEHLRVALLSVAGGSAVAAKCPLAYCNSQLIVLTKCDLVPHTEFDLDATLHALRALNQHAELICTSARQMSGAGRLAGWLLGYVRAQRTRALGAERIVREPGVGLPI